MLRYLLLFSFLIAFYPVKLIASVIKIPIDQPDIQSGIYTANNGDTVLVAPGVYRENINFKGKNIVVASHFIIDADENLINSTIIDGSNPVHSDTASCVLFISGEDSSAALQGFTLTGGQGTKWPDTHIGGFYREGGGILIELSSPSIKNNIIINNEAINTNGVTSAGGGAIRCGDGNPRIFNNIIKSNKGRYGAGIVLNFSGAIIKNNIICNNTGGQDYGGSGIWAYANGSYPKIINNNTIVENSSIGGGAYGGKVGGLLIWSTSVIGKNNITWGNTQSSGGQIALLGASADITYSNVEGGFSGTGNINQDPLFDNSNLYLRSGSPCIDAGDPDPIYNDPEDPSNPGFALWPAQDSLRNDMGAYGGPECKIFPLFLSTNLLNQPESVVFDSLHSRYFVSCAGNGNIIQINNVGAQSYFADYASSIRGITIVDSILFTAGNGGVVGFNIYTADTVFILPIAGAGFLNDVVYDESDYLYVSDTGGNKVYKIHIDSQSYTTFVSSGLNSPNGLIFDQNNNRLILCSFRSNSPIQAISLLDSSVSTIITTNLSNLDGLAKDDQGNYYVSAWGDNSVYQFDQNFANPPQAISSGHSGPADICFNKISNMIAVPNFNSNSIDYIDLTIASVKKSHGTHSPKSIHLRQNYPNPFNPTTTIEYALNIKKWSPVQITIYNNIGQIVKTLVNELKNPGLHYVIWDGTNNHGEQVTSGIYFGNLQTGSYSKSIKMVLLH